MPAQSIPGFINPNSQGEPEKNMTAKDFFKTEIVTLVPTAFDDVRTAADQLKQGKPALVNLSNLSPEERLWALHFLNGVIYAMDGQTRDIGNRVYLFAPPNIDVSMDEPV
jgi:cell division inhibitor SepF